MSRPPLYLQLHSLRHETAVDPEGVLRQVPGLGFDGVEIVDHYGWSAGKWRALLDETGLNVVAAHVALEALEGDLTAALVFFRALGTCQLVVTALPRAPQTAERYHGGARRLNAASQHLAAEGFSLAYHHHEFEFRWTEEPGGRNGLDILLAETDPTLVGFEFDTHWLEHAGQDALAFIRMHADRTRLIHAKDFRRRDGRDVPAGKGDVDFRALLPLCAARGWATVLEYEGDHALQSVRAGADFLRSLPA